MRHHVTIAMLCTTLALAGCARLDALWPFGAGGGNAPVADARPPAEAAPPADADTVRPRPRPGDDDDAAAGTGLRSLGTSVASLGDPTRPGLWVQTPRVEVDTSGRVIATESGAAADMAVIAAPGDGGSRLSLAAMRALGVNPSDLVEIEIRVP